MGEACEGLGRGLEQGLIGEPLMRADKGPECFWDGEGDEKGRPRKLFVELVLEPSLGLMVLALGTVTVASGVVDAVLSPAGLTLREAVAIVAALAGLDGAYDLSV